MPVYGDYATLASGVVAPSQLGSGSPDSTKYLRGDGAWQVPAGGGNDPRLILFGAASAQNITGTTILDITGMSFAAVANSTYLFYCAVDLTASGGTAPTHNYQFTGPVSPTRVSIKRTQMSSATAQTIGIVAALTTNFGALATVANTKHIFEGVIVTGAAGGTVQLRVTPAGTLPTSTVGAGSSGWAKKVA